jgi:ribosomal protein L39E
MLATTPVLFAATWLPFRAREWAQKRAARRFGVTSPLPVGRAVALHLALTLGATVPRAHARLRGRQPAPVPFWLYASTYAVHQFNLRRSWRRAYAAASASQDLSSASSSTSGVCAPETP